MKIKNLSLCKLMFAMLLSAMLLSSCVSLKEYESLQSQYGEAMKSWKVTRQELKELREENAALVRQSQAMTAQMSDLAAARTECEATVTTLNRSYAALQLHYDTTVENYMQQLTGKNRDLSKVNKMLEQRTHELNEKEQAFREREQAMLAQQKQLQEQQELMEQNERATSEALQAKQRELESLRNAVSQALMGFADKGLDVETKDGKVYVSMADKLLFASGSWKVSAQGEQALQSLARMLEENTELNIMVEGHTDNVPYHRTGDVADNWDLSVMRATAIVKLLLKMGPQIDPSRIEAAGHAEYSPRRPNTTAANKAANRRTEIILTPRLNDIIKMIGE